MNNRTRKLDLRTRRLPETAGKKPLGRGELETGIARCWGCQETEGLTFDPIYKLFFCDDCAEAMEARIA